MNYSFRKYKQQYSALLRLGLPIMLGQIGVIATGFFDTLMVGHYSTEALASASFVNSLFNCISIMCMGFSYGLTPIIGALFARGESENMGHNLRNAIAVNMAFAGVSIVIMTILYAFIDDLGQPEELMPLIKPYFLIVMFSNIPLMLVNTMKQFSDGITDTKLGMWILTAGNVLNVIGNYLLIYGKLGFPELGLMGAGLSTLIARIAMAVTYIIVFNRSRRYTEYTHFTLKASLSRATLKSIFATSMPIAIQMGLETGSFTAASIMIGWLGKNELAAYQVMLIIGMLGFMIYYSIGASMTIMIANYKGADNRAKIRQCSIAGYHIILACATATCITFYAFCDDIIRLFTNDPAVIAISLTLIIPMMLYQFGDATQIAYCNALRGIAEVKPTMRIATIAYLIVGLPATYIFAFPFGWGIVGIYLSFTVSLMLAGILFMHRFYTHPLVKVQ